jgi:hypothetical protein
LERLGKGERGVSEEIRERIERTFKEDEIDAPTRELRDFLVHIAAQLRDDYGTDWHKAPRAYQAFVAAIIEQLRPYEPVREPGPVAASDLLYLGPDHPPDVVGKLRARDVRRTHSYPQLEAALEAERERRRRSGVSVQSKKKEGKHE